MKPIRKYLSFEDDFEKSANQNFQLPDDYKWIRKDLKSVILSRLIYGLALVFGGMYCKFVLRMKIRGRKNIKGLKEGFFLYGNHTQPIGDVFIPALCVFPKRIYTVVSPANYGIPVIGKILPFLGALPTVNSLHGLRELHTAIEKRVENGHPIIIYPEAHVWEYYTKIRPFAETSFKFPAKLNRPVVVMTVTYKKSRMLKRPKMEVYLDGPFYPQGESIKEKTADFHRKVYEKMKERSLNSDCEYILYRKKEK